ncbi:hypothetical protein, partial [uncultured Roseibium sp.]|uniref:hypothetical protein n=1 Tax=uncultured Roseibium sp. TaxID=1936171 RepID=UPI0026230932
LRVALRVALYVALSVALSVALRVALLFLPCQMAADAPKAKAITNGEGTMTTRGFFSPATSYNPSIAGIIFSGSIGSVRIARLIQSFA